MKKEKVEILMWLIMALSSGIAYFFTPESNEFLIHRFALGFISGGSFVYSMFRFVRI